MVVIKDFGSVIKTRGRDQARVRTWALRILVNIGPQNLKITLYIKSFPSCYYLIQRESRYTTFHMETRFSCTVIVLQIKFASI